MPDANTVAITLPAFCAAVWTILDATCHAGPDRYGFAATAGAFSEWRVQGALGFGGKIRNEARGLHVTCYREDETPIRLAMIAEANRLLAALLAAHRAAAPTPPGLPKQPEIIAALTASNLALDDWTHTYAPELCGGRHVLASKDRIAFWGVTLAYIAKVRRDNTAALAMLAPSEQTANTDAANATQS